MLQVLVGQVLPIPVQGTVVDQTVVMQIRLPRILGAVVVGAALSASGAACQTTFRTRWCPRSSSGSPPPA